MKIIQLKLFVYVIMHNVWNVYFFICYFHYSYYYILCSLFCCEHSFDVVAFKRWICCYDFYYSKLKINKTTCLQIAVKIKRSCEKLSSDLHFTCFFSFFFICIFSWRISHPMYIVCFVSFTDCVRVQIVSLEKWLLKSQ